MYRWLRHVAWPFLYAVYEQFNRDEGTVLAGYIAYATMLAGLPFLLFVTATAGMVIGEDGSQQAVDRLFSLLPVNVAQTIEPVLLDVIGQRRDGIATASLLGFLWVASSGVEAIRISLDRAYQVEKPRNYFLRRLRAVFFVFTGFFTFFILAVLIIFAPLIFNLIEAYAGIDVPTVVEPLRYIIGGSILVIFFWIVHRLLPSRSMKGFRLMPGIIASVVLWGVIASMLSVYLSYAPSYSLTYGTLAGVILTLIFLYLTGITIILGAEINSVLNERLFARRAAAASGPDGGPDASG
ncbi:YihY/virulence factor BrkB family protein [Rhodobacteraceae bacterium NNCM2]|nr:YihY/virulence factor BrkB family protein [Coraliihabitans acroporae]